MSDMMEFYTKDDAASEQIGADVYRRVSIPIDDFNAGCDHYGFVMERTCKLGGEVPAFDMTLNMLADIPWYWCLECGAATPSISNYCMHCGAKVVSE